MSLGKQLQVIKQNWLVSAIVAVVLLLFLSNSFGYSGYTPSYSPSYDSRASDGESMGALYEVSQGESLKSIAPSYGGEVAPQTRERSVVKTASLESETARGEFDQNADQVKSVVKNLNGFVLYENVYTSGEKERDKTKHGYFDLRVPVESYDSAISQLKQLGKVQSFTENAEDITAQKVNLEAELSAEKARLERYQQLLKEATNVEEKLGLVDRIFNQERTITYYEDALKNVEEQVSYTRISVRLDEKESSYANIVFVKFSELVSALVGSLNSLLVFLFGVLPWAVAAGIIWLFVRWIRRR